MDIRPPRITAKTRLGFSGVSYRNLVAEVDSAADAYYEMKEGESFTSLATRSKPPCSDPDNIPIFDSSAAKPKPKEFEDYDDPEEALEVAVVDYKNASNKAREVCIQCPLRSHCLAYSLTNVQKGDGFAPDPNMVYGAWTPSTRKSTISKLFLEVVNKREEEIKFAEEEAKKDHGEFQQ